VLILQGYRARTAALLFICLWIAACGATGEAPQGFRATSAPVNPNAPVYTLTPSLTPTDTRTPTPTLTFTPTHTLTATFTYTPTVTFTPEPTQPLWTLTAPVSDGAPVAGTPEAALFTTPEGWSCEEFPCEEDIQGFLARIQVPQGYSLEHVGRFPGQPLQIAYGADGRLYATVLENGTLTGGVYVLNRDGSTERYSQDTFFSPVGLAFQPGTDALYVSARTTATAGGSLWRVLPDGSAEIVLDDLPCCFDVVGNQPNGMVFGPDGYLYLGVGSLSDHAEPSNPQREKYATPQPYEASILRIQPHTGEIETFVEGIRNPYDLAFDSTGQFYATDNGILEGLGDRILKIDEGKHYGFPYWRSRGCFECPLTNFSLDIQPDFVPLPDYTLPRGITVYTGTQFPGSVFNDVFVALWNGTPNGQRIIRIDPETVPTNPEDLAAYTPQPFMTGLIRPTDVIVAPDGSLVVADFVYGHVWKVWYGDVPPKPAGNPVFVTSTPRP
jgi:hypothetical protein